jgi:hypothetical protein
MKKIILLLICMIFLFGIVNAYVCQDDTDDDNIPCEIITPSAINCSKNASVINLNTSAQFNYSMGEVGDGTCNFTFNLTKDGTTFEIGESFSIALRDKNWTGTLNIVADEDPDVNLWLTFFIIFFILLIFGIAWHNENYLGNIFLFAAGCLTLLMGIWIFQSGISIYGVSQYWVFPFAWILVGISVVLILYSSLDMIYKEEI